MTSTCKTQTANCKPLANSHNKHRSKYIYLYIYAHCTTHILYIWRCKQVSHEWFNNQPFNPSDSWNKSSSESIHQNAQIKTKEKKEGLLLRACMSVCERESEKHFVSHKTYYTRHTFALQTIKFWVKELWQLHAPTLTGEA